MPKDRRIYRDNTEEMILSFDLWGAVLKQAFEDVKRLPIVKAQLENMKVSDYKAFKDFRCVKKSFEDEKRECNSACHFFRTKRLERFITSHTLPLEPTYIRRKYKELQKSIRDRKVEQ